MRIAEIKVTLSLIVILGLFLTCERQVFDNVYDPAYKIESVKGLIGEQVGEHIKLNWQKNDDVKTSYVIERKTPGESEFSILIDSISANDTTYVDSFITTDTTYFYKISGRSGKNNSPYSETVQVETVFPKPTNLRAIPISDNQIQLTWIDNSEFESGFKMERKSEGEGFSVIGEVTTNDTTNIDTGLNYGLDYVYRVRAFSLVNKSNYSDEVVGNTTIPAPANLTAIRTSDSEIRLDWVDNCTFESGFKIERKLESDGYVEISEIAANETTYLDQNLTYGTYYYRVKAFTALNESSYTNTATGWLGYTFYQTFGGSTFDKANSVKQTPDEGYIITGLTSSYGAGGSDVWLIKTHEDGTEEWNETFGGSSDEGMNSVIETWDGGYLVGGFTRSYGAGDYDIWILKVSNGGSEEWNETFGDGDFDIGYSVMQTTDGGYIVVGQSTSGGVRLIKMNTNGSEEWNRSFDETNGGGGNSVQQISDDGYIICGWTYNDVLILKTDSEGNLDWYKTFGGSDVDKGNSIKQTNDGGYIIAGTTQSYGSGLSDIWLIKTDVNGDSEWMHTFGGSSSEGGYSVEQTTDGGFVITGWTNSYGAGSRDMWLIKTDAYGNENWARTYGGPDVDEGYYVELTNDGGYIVTGVTTSYGAGDYDVWLIKTDPDGYVYE